MNNPASIASSRPIREYVLFALILGAAILLFWWRVWIPTPSDRMHFSDDILIKDYPTRMGLFRQVLDGRLPMWDPYQFGGWPGLANCEVGVFYPPNWATVPFSNSPEFAFQIAQWLVLLHLFIVGFGTYRYSRYIGLSPLSSCFASFALTFCGFLCAHKKHTNMIFTLAWFPWLLLQAERWICERSPRYLFRLTALLALAYLAGHPQSSLYVTLLVAARLLVGVFEGNSVGFKNTQWFRGLMPIAGVFALSASLAAIQYVPTAELIQQSARSDADAFSRSSEFSLPPVELLEAFFPESLDFISQTEVFYWGLVPLLLTIHFVLRWKLKALDYYLLGVLAASILLSLGEYLFAYDLSYLLIPGSAWVRAPSRWIFFAGLPMALAAGREIDCLLNERRDAPQRFLHSSYWKIVGVLGVFVTIAFFTIFFAVGDSIAAEARFAVRRELMRSYLYALLFGGTFLMLLHLALGRRIAPAVFAVGATFILWIDLGTHFRTFDLEPGAGGYSVDTEVERLGESVWNHRTKVFFEAGGNRALYHGAAQDFYEMDGQSPLTPRLHLELREDTRLSDKPNLTLFRLWGVRSVLTDEPNLPGSFERETQRLYWIDDASPRAFALDEFLRADLKTQRQLLKLQSFPFQRVAIVGDASVKDAEAETPLGSLFCKPFLLASCSANSVQSNAFLIVDGKNHFEDIGDERAGYYIAVADPLSGKIEDAQAFNLMESLVDDPEEHAIHHRLLDFIREIPEGKIVFAAVRDNAANSLLPVGVSALREIGASLDARGRFRLAHAIVGRKGAPIGSALEIFSATEAMVLQTAQSVTIEGDVCPKPEPEWRATSNLAEKWYALRCGMKADEERAVRFELSGDAKNATDPLRLPFPVTVFSAPKKEVAFPTEDRASIRLGGEEYALNRRGYNLVDFDPKTQSVVNSDSFDLFLDYDSSASPTFIKEASPENNRMQRFIRSVPDGHFILGAVRDDGTDLMTPATLDCLHEIGSALIFNATDPYQRKRIAHAFVAIKGASRCIETFAKETDSIVFNRYPGGPALSHTEIGGEAGSFVPANPIDEMMERIEGSASPTRLRERVREWSVVEDDVDRIRLSGRSENGDLVFVGEMFYPGWTAYVDGVARPIHRLDYYFRGIEVPAGLHEIELIYAPASFRFGATISAIGLIALLVWWIVLLTKKRTAAG